jgi:predicted permease
MRIWWARLRNALRRDRALDEIDEELQSHLDEAVARGRDPEEVRRAFGAPHRWREASFDARALAWIDAVAGDARFGLRQLAKRPVTSMAAVLSLGLSMGATLTAARVIDALFWRPLPIAHPERLHAISRGALLPDGRYGSVDVWSYPSFLAMQGSVAGDAELVALSPAQPLDVLVGAGPDVERASVQYVSGNLFPAFQIRPAAGRLIAPSDDLPPAADVAVLSYAYWASRFGADPGVIGRSLRIGGSPVTIAGVAARDFAGAEPGVPIDIYLPAAQHSGYAKDDWTWTRALALVDPRRAAPVGDALDATWHAFERERASHFVNVPAEVVEQNLAPRVRLSAAPTGASAMRERYADPLRALAALVALVLLIACANVAMLMSAQATSRQREWTLRAAIGAGRARLAQLVGVEGLLLTATAAAVGILFTAWAAPFVVTHTAAAETRVVLDLKPDRRVAGVAAALVGLCACLVAAWPMARAWRTSTDAAAASDHRHTARRLTTTLVGAQVAFGMFVLFVAGLSIHTLARLNSRPLGFDTAHTIVADVAASAPQPWPNWQQLEVAAAALPGVDDAALSMWPMLAGRSWHGFVSVDGAPASDTQADFLGVSPGFFPASSMPVVAGRDLSASDVQPGQAVVNETFARVFLGERAAIGHHFAKGRDQYEIVGVVHDAVYGDVHEPVPPVAFVPLRTSGNAGMSAAALSVRVAPGRTADDIDAALRRLVSATNGRFRLRGVQRGQALVDSQLVRERLMSMLAGFFGAVAMTLVGVGLYGSLHHRVRQRTAEIAIRRAVGASSARIAWLIGWTSVVAVAIGAVVGLAAGYIAAGAAQSLFYGVTRSDATTLIGPLVAVLIVALAASLAPIRRALTISPARVLRNE